MLEWLKGAAFIILCLSTTFTVVTVGKHVSNTLMAMDESIAKLNTEIDEAHRLTLEAALTASEARKASIKESKMLDMWNTQIDATMSDVRVAVQSIQATSSIAQDTLRATTQTIQSFQAPIEQLTATLKAGQIVTEHLDLTVDHINALVTDPAIPATLVNVQGMTANGNAATKDLKDYIHGILHPSWPKRLWGYSTDLAHAVL